MLRRRIFASAMASVMALTSVAVVASADETAVSNVKTKADLEELVKSLDSFRSNEIYDYGSLSGEDFLNAIEYADNVLANDGSTVDDYTVAYLMVTEVKARLVIYTADQLKTLVDSSTKIYETNNICNEELGDLLYKGGWDAFVDAYEEAESVLGSSDSRIITDAYEKLDAAKKALDPAPSVTKAQFRDALKAYETALQKEFAYDAWRVGTVSETYKETVAYGTLYEHVASMKNEIVTQYGILNEIKELNKTTQTDIYAAYEACTKLTALFNSFTPDDTARATKANVKTLLKTYNGRLVHDYKTTAAEDLYTEIVDLLGAANVHNKLGDKYSSSIDTKKSAVAAKDAWYVVSEGYWVSPNGRVGKSVVKDISAELTIKADVKFYIGLDENGYALGVSTTNKSGTMQESYEFNDGTYDHAGLVYTLTEDLVVDGEVQAAAGTEVVCVDGGSVFKYDDFKANPTSWPGWIAASIADVSAEKKMITVIPVEGAKTYKLINKGSTVDLTDYIEITADDILDNYSLVDNHNSNNVDDGDATGDWAIGGWDAVSGASQDMDGSYTNSSGAPVPTHAVLDDAIELALDFIAGNYDGIYDIDTIGQINENSARGSSAEWTLVYRYLKYALSDKYDASFGTHTKADVIALIDDCYDLANKTGDAALFNYHHMQLVDAREDALAWVKAANKIKTYKDNVTSASFDAKVMADAADGMVADQVYNKLWDYYEALKKDYDVFQYSFGEVYSYIAEVSDMIDSGEIVATDDVVTALKDTAYYLSTVNTLVGSENGTEIDYYDNDAFTSDREFQGFNRVYTNSVVNGIWTSGTYDMMLDAATKFTVGVDLAWNVPGVNYDHYLLAKAYTDLKAAVKAQTDPTVVLGDVNGDGAVTAADASEILKAVVGLRDAVANEVGDFNGDGSVTSADAAAILKSVIGL